MQTNKFVYIYGWFAPYFDQSLFTHNVNYFIGLHILLKKETDAKESVEFFHNKVSMYLEAVE